MLKIWQDMVSTMLLAAHEVVNTPPRLTQPVAPMTAAVARSSALRQ